MNPTVKAAWIAAGIGGLGIVSTAVVAVVGARNTRRVNGQTIQAATDNTIRALDAARDDKLWEQQRAAYHELSAYLLFIQAKRRHDTRLYRLDDLGEEALQRLLGSYKPPSWWELQARIAHYGSEEVITQVEASHDADNQVAVCVIRLADLNQQAKDATAVGNPAGSPDIRDVQAARKELKDARARADEID
jgi:hypothetical protein